jgi:hypothetical protein
MESVDFQCIGVATQENNRRCLRDASMGKFCVAHAQRARSLRTRYKALTWHAQTAFSAMQEIESIDALKGTYAVLMRARQLRQQFGDTHVHASCRDAAHLWFEDQLETLAHQVESKLVTIFANVLAKQEEEDAQSHVAAQEVIADELDADKLDADAGDTVHAARRSKNRLRRKRLKQRKQTEQLLKTLSMDRTAQYHSLRVEASQLYRRVYCQMVQWAEQVAPELTTPLYAADQSFDTKLSDDATLSIRRWTSDELRAAVAIGARDNDAVEDEAEAEDLNLQWFFLMYQSKPGRCAMNDLVFFYLREFLDVIHHDKAKQISSECRRTGTSTFSASQRREMEKTFVSDMSAEQAVRSLPTLYQWLLDGGDALHIQLITNRHRNSATLDACLVLLDTFDISHYKDKKIDMDDACQFYEWFIEFADALHERAQAVALGQRLESAVVCKLDCLLQPDTYRELKRQNAQTQTSAYLAQVRQHRKDGLCICGCAEIQPSKRRFIKGEHVPRERLANSRAPPLTP